MTYHRDPPGLQIFSMVQPALIGGESVFADGFAAADFLKCKSPEAFSILSNVTRTYRCVDSETGWHLKGTGPIISTNNGLVTAIRHNDLDRLSDLPPYGSSRDEASAFYDKLTFAHQKWDEILAMDEFRLVIGLKPGDTAVVANQVSSCMGIVDVWQWKCAS
jgi:gamma-butyrobetaine dioxygenase